MINSYDPAFPVPPPSYDTERCHWSELPTGMTIRAHFAVMAMQGIIANPNYALSPVESADLAVYRADALIEELNKETKKRDVLTLLKLALPYIVPSDHEARDEAELREEYPGHSADTDALAEEIREMLRGNK